MKKDEVYVSSEVWIVPDGELINIINRCGMIDLYQSINQTLFEREIEIETEWRK